VPGRLLPSPLRWPAAAVLAGCAAVTAGFGVSLAGKRPSGWLDTAADARIQSALDQHAPILRFLVGAGTLMPVTLMTAALVVACVLTRRWSGAVLAAVAVPAGITLAEYVLKPLIGRTMLGALSFPSGHVTAVFALAGACAVLLVDPPGHRVPGPARLLLALAALLAASAVAVATVAQAAHYFTDVVGGAAVGTGVVLACALTLDALATRHVPATGPRRGRRETGVGSSRKGARMSSSPESPHLDNHHRNTLRQIFEHPVSHNIEWHAVTSLLEAVGTVTVHHDGKVTVTVGPERTIFDPPAGKDIDAQMVVDLRHMLSKAGYGAS